MTLRMLTQGLRYNHESQAMETLQGRQVNLVSAIGRVLHADYDDGNSLKIKINFTDDTQSIQLAYFVKHSQQDKP